MRFCSRSASRQSQLLRALAGLVLALGLPTLARAQAFQLGVRIDRPMGTYPASVALADMNGDGIPDLVSTNSQDNNISITLGLGGGAYAPRVNFATGGNTLHVTVADFNRDGRPDVAATNFDAGTISILLGNGAGGLGPKVDMAAEFRPRSITVVDVNGDNLLDLVVPNYGANNVSVFLGNGNGGFGPRTNYAGFTNPTCAATPDLNGDGRPDLVVTNNGGTTISVLLANGSGGFGAKTDYSVGAGSSPHWVASGDLNNDGFDDVAVADVGSSQFSILLGNGTGALLPRTDFALASAPYTIALADMNADGLADVVTVLGNNMVSVNAGNGSGGFGSAATFATPVGPVHAEVGDLNGDGRPDIATANQYSNSISVLFGNGTGGFRARSDITSLAGPYNVAMADANGDGRLDLATPNLLGNSASVLLNSGTGGFGPKLDVGVGASPTDITLADFNNDGKLDFATATGTTALTVLFGNGIGGFGGRIDPPVLGATSAVASGDFNNDGHPDLVAAYSFGNVISVLMGNGLGGFAAKTDYATGSCPQAVVVADVTGDGKLDLVTANGCSNNVSVMVGAGNGFFSAGVAYPTGTNPRAIAVGDLNGDGSLDLAVANRNSNTVSILLNLGAGTFGPKTDIATPNGIWGVAVGDVNGDSRPDLMFSTNTLSGLSVMLGNGAGAFGPQVDYDTGGAGGGVTTGDLSGDGDIDIALEQYNNGKVAVFLGLTRTATALSVGSNPAVVGAPILLTATVSVPAPGSGAPTGTVRFFDGNRLLGTSPVNGGAAALWVSATRLGSRSLSAVYSGDGEFFGSISPSRDLQVVSSAAAQITGIVDVPNDQGYQVRMTFNASPFDYLGSPTPIANYLLYRKIDAALVAGNEVQVKAAPPLLRLAVGPSVAELAGWDFLMTIPATADKVYEAVVPTLINGAGNLSTFFVRAALSTPGLFYDSPQAQGYSLDNLPPAPPAPFVGNYSGGAAHLSWGQNEEPDLAQYRLYRGSSAGFVPGPGNLVTVTAGTTYDDVGPAGSFYKLSAADVNGNESAYTLLTPSGTTGVDDGPVAFALGRLANPVMGGRLTVSFALPSAERATLEMVDVSGRAVARQDVGALGVGRHAVTLGDGTPLPAGMYFVRLTQGRQGAMARVTVLR